VALYPEAVDNTDDDFAVVSPETPKTPGMRVTVPGPELQQDDDFALVDIDRDFEVEEAQPAQQVQPKPAISLPDIQPRPVAKVPEKPGMTEELNARLDRFSSAAATQISELYNIPSEDAMAMMLKLREDTRKKYDEEMVDSLKDQEEYDRGYTTKFQENLGELISQGTKMQMVGGPDAFLEGRENAERRKAARQKAIDEFDVNFVSRAAASGILQTAGGFVDFGATITSLVGADSASKYLTEKGRELAEVNSFIPFKVQSTEDIQNVWDVGALAAKASIEMAPQVAASYLAGGLALRGATTLRGGKMLTETGQQVVRGAGAFASNTALETGGIAREQMETNNMLDPKMALLGGAAAGSLETVSDVLLFKKLWPLLGVGQRELLIKDFAGKTTGEAIRQIGRYTGSSVLQQMPVETLTEIGQEGIAIGAVELSKRDPEFFQSPELDGEKWNRYTKRLVDAGVYGGLGSIGLTGTLTGAQGTLIATQANRTYARIQQARKEAEQGGQKKEEYVKAAAATAEAASAPQTAKALLEVNDLGTLVEKEEPSEQQEKTEDVKEEEATQPRAGGDLGEFQLTDKVFKTQEEAEAFILSQKNPGDFEMMDNSNVDDEGEIFPEFIILKREGTEMAEPAQKETSEERPTQEVISEQTPEPDQEAKPKAAATQEKAAAQPASVQPEIAQQGAEAVDPALAPVVEPSATTSNVQYVRNPNATRHRTDPLSKSQPIRIQAGPVQLQGDTSGRRKALIAYEKFLNKQPLGADEVSTLIYWAEKEGIKIPFFDGETQEESSDPSWVLSEDGFTWTNKTDKPTNRKLIVYAPDFTEPGSKIADLGGTRYDLLPESVTAPNKGQTTFGELNLTETAQDKLVTKTTTSENSGIAEIKPNEKSPGHVGFYEYDGATYELYKDAKGDLFRAPVSNVFDANTGYRIGRWEANAAQADAQAARILGTQKAEEPKDKTSTKIEENLLNASQADFLRSVVAILGEDSKEARKTAADMLLARFQRASQRAEYEEAKSVAGQLDTISDIMEERDGDKSFKETWQTERSIAAFTEGFHSGNGIGYLGKPGAAINKYVEQYRGTPQFKEKLYDKMMERYLSFVSKIKAGKKGREKLPVQEGKEKSPPVVTDSYGEWVEYGKNWAGSRSSYEARNVGAQNARDSANVSYEGMAELRLGQTQQYTDDGKKVEVETRELGAEDRGILEEDVEIQEKALAEASAKMAELKTRFEKNPIERAVFDALLGEMGLPNDSDYGLTTDDFDIAQDLKDEVKDEKKNPLQTSTIQKRLSEARNKVVLPAVQEALALSRQQMREVTKPEATKKEARAQKQSARETRAAKNQIFEKMRDLQKDGLITYAQMQEAMDLVPQAPNEKTLQGINEFIDGVLTDEPFDGETFAAIIKERIVANETDQAENTQGTQSSPRGLLPDETGDTGARQTAQRDQPNDAGRSKSGATLQPSQESPREQEAGEGSEQASQPVDENLRASEEEIARKVRATANRAEVEARAGRITEDVRRGISDAFIRAYADESPRAIEDALRAAEALLDISEAQKSLPKPGDEGTGRRVRASVDRGPESLGLDNAGVPGQVAGETAAADRQEVQRPAGRSETVSGGNQQPGRVSQPSATNEAQPDLAPEKEYGPRPGLQTSFEGELPKEVKQYVQAGDFQLDEKQALAVNLTIAAWETTKIQDPKDRKRGFILGDGTGIGKTLTYLVAGQKIFELSGKKVLLLALNDTWLEQRFLADVAKFGINIDAFFVATYPQLRKGIITEDASFSAVIFDEAHALKNQDSLTAKAAAKIQTPFRVFATATPLDEATQAAYFLSELTGETEDQVLASLGFRVRYDQDEFTGELRRRVQQVAKPKDVQKALGELGLSATRNGQYVRRYYPFWGTIREVSLKLNPQQRKAYEKEMEIWERKIAMSENRMNVKGQRTQAMKRWTEIQKNQYVFDLTTDWLKKNPTGKVVVFSTTANKQKSQASSSKNQDADLLGVAGFMAQELDKRGIKYVKLFGGNKNQKNTFGPLKEFQSRSLETRVAIATLASGGTGIDLDDTFGDRPRLVIMAGTDFSAAVVEQAMGRTSRRNTKSPSDLRMIKVPESYGDQRAGEIQEGKMENLRSIQGQQVEEVEVENGGHLNGDITTLMPMTLNSENVSLQKLGEIELDSRYEQLPEEQKTTVKAAAELLGKSHPRAKIVFGDQGDNPTWTDFTLGRLDVVYINPEKLHAIVGPSLKDEKAAPRISESLELVLDEEMSHNSFYQVLFDEADARGVDRYQYVMDELGKIHKGLSEELRDKVREMYESGGGAIKSNEHLAAEYVRMVHQWTRRGTITEAYFKPREGTPRLFTQLLPRARVAADGQVALAKLFHHILNFLKGLVRSSNSQIREKELQKRIEAMDKVFKETKAPTYGAFGNVPMFDHEKTFPSGIRKDGYIISGQSVFRIDGAPAAIRLTRMKGADGSEVTPSGLAENPDQKKYDRVRPVPRKLASSSTIDSDKDLSEAYQKMRIEEPTLKEKFNYFWVRAMKGAESRIFNHMAPIKYLEEQAVISLREKMNGEWPADASGHDLFPAEYSAYKLFVLAQDAGAIVEEALQRGVPTLKKGSLEIKEGSKGLVQIFAPLNTKEDARDFRLYMFGRRAKELESLGKKSGLTETQIQKIEQMGSRKSGKFKDGPTFSQIFEEYREFQDQVLQFAVDTGLVKPELKELLNEMHKDYVPYYRISDSRSDDFDAQAAQVMGPYSKKQMAGQRPGIRRYTGGTQFVNDIYSNIEKNISHLITASVRNLAMQRLETLNTINTQETGQNFWEVVTPMTQVMVPKEKIKAFIKDQIGEDVAEEIDTDGLAKFFGFTSGAKDRLEKGVVSYVKGGKVVYRKIEEGNESLLNALTLQQNEMSKLLQKATMRVLVGTRRLFQRGITTSLEFLGANVMRDSVMASMLNPKSFLPIQNTLKGLVSLVTDKKLLSDLRLQGAGNPTNYADIRGRGTLARSNPNLQPDDTHGLVEFTVKGIEQGLVLLDALGQASETTARMSVVRAAMKDKNLSNMEKAWVYRQSTTDFSLHGAHWIIRSLNALVPFFQAGLNGLYRTYLAAKTPAKNAPGIFGMNDFFSKCAILSSIAVLYGVMKALDPRYADLPDDELDRYFVFFVNGIKIRIPKPHEVGALFFTIPEKVVDTMVSGDLKKFGKDFASVLGGIFRFNYIPQFLQPAANVAMDKNMFLGTPIKGQGMQDLPPSLQYRDDTPTILSEGFSQLPGIKDTPILGSPVQMQALVEGYFGTLGNYFLVLSSAILDTVRQKEYGESPKKPYYESILGVRRFMQKAGERGGTPTYRTKYAKEFYEVYDQIKMADRVFSAAKKMTDEEKAGDYTKQYALAKDWSSDFRRAADEINTINDELRGIRKNKELTGEEKQVLIDDLKRQKNDIMKSMVIDYKETLKEAEQAGQ